MSKTKKADYSPEAQYKRIFAEERKCSPSIKEEEIARLKESSEAIAKSGGHNLGNWNKDSGKFHGYGFYARCVHKHCTAFAWVTDRKSRYPLRGSIHEFQHRCPLRKSGG